MSCWPRPDCGGRRPGCPLAASSSETLLVAPGSLLVPRPPSPGARVLLPPLGARRAALRDSGAERSAAWRRPAGWLRLEQLSPARRADRARRPAGSAGAAREQDPLCADLRASVPGARHLPQGLPPPPPSLPPLPLPPPPPAAAASFPPPHPSSARLVPLRSGAPGSGLVTWPSRHPVALKKKKRLCFANNRSGF